MPPPAGERWSILAGIPRVVEDKEAKRVFPPSADVSLARNVPPRASVLTVPFRVSSPPCLHIHPYVSAADSSGLLLLRATEPDGTFNSVVTYHLCDARTGESVCLCNHGRGVGFHGDNIGLMTKEEGGGGCVVAELQPAGDGTGRATLLRYTVGQYKWAEKELTYSPPLHRYWFGEGVVSHGGMLWWVDLSYGLLAFDPFADDPELLHVPLPTVPDQLPVISANAGAHRCVRASGGRLRYVQIHGDPSAPVVSTWALTEDRKWNPERSVALADVWTDESYLDTMLPWEMPALALLHPHDPDKVYYFLGSGIFAVDLRRKKVLEFSDFGMPDPPNDLLVRSSHFVHAWQYDPSSSRPDFVLTCLRQDKEIAARSSRSAIMPVSRKTAKKKKRLRDGLIREQQEAMRLIMPTLHVGGP